MEKYMQREKRHKTQNEEFGIKMEYHFPFFFSFSLARSHTPALVGFIIFFVPFWTTSADQLRTFYDTVKDHKIN